MSANTPFLSDSDVNTMREQLEIDLEDDIYLHNNLLNWFPKGPGEGDFLSVPLRIAGTTQHGADDVAGLAGVSGVRSVFDKFIFPWCPTYGFAEVPMTSIALSQNKETGAVPLLVDAVRDARKSCARDVEAALAGDGFGTRGVISSYTGSGPYVLTLTNVSDALPLNFGDTLVSSPAKNSSSLDTGSATISAVDRDAGTVTVTANSSWTPTATHYLFLALDKTASVGYANPSKIYGLRAILPSSSADRTATFANVDRSKDPQNLAGILVNGSFTAIRAAINNAIAKLMPKEGAGELGIAMSANTMMALQIELQNSVKYTDVDVEGTINFPGISFNTTMGKAKAFFGMGILDNEIYVLSRDSWMYRSPIKGDVVQSATNSGKDFVDSYNAVRAQVRQWSFGALECKAPGLNAVIKLS